VTRAVAVPRALRRERVGIDARALDERALRGVIVFVLLSSRRYCRA
jgi:hypothetical protein